MSKAQPLRGTRLKWSEDVNSCSRVHICTEGRGVSAPQATRSQFTAAETLEGLREGSILLWGGMGAKGGKPVASGPHEEKKWDFLSFFLIRTRTGSN